MNFVSSCVWYIHDEHMYTGYAPDVFSHSRDEEGSKGWAAPFTPTITSGHGSMHGEGFFFTTHLLRADFFHLKQDFVT
jgi:hypothetical protein